MIKTIFKKLLYLGITEEKAKKRVREEEDYLFRGTTKRYSRGNVLLQQGQYKSKLEERRQANCA